MLNRSPIPAPLADAFKAARRPSSGRHVPAAEALPRARAWLARLAEAEAERDAARAQLAEAQATDGRRFAPGMVAARDRLARADSDWFAAWRATNPRAAAWGRSATLGAPFAIGGRYGWQVQWCEAPPFRFAGLASDLTRLGHTGWYTDDDDSELARGVVYQLTARDGRARFVPAVADPINADSDGRGPAMLALADMVTADGPDESAADDARRDAARRADELAERYAESEREWREADRAGQAARGLAAEARAEGLAWVAAVRALRGRFAARHGFGLVGLSPADARELVRLAVAEVRATCDAYRDARERAAEARRERPGKRDRLAEAWADGYANGADL